MLFPSIQFIITGLQFQMSINTQSTNTQIQFVTKCQKDQTYALFLNSWCFQDVRNCVPKCLIQKYRNKDTQIQLYTIHIPQPCARRAHGHTPMYNFNWRICIPQKLADFIHYKYIYFKIIPPILRPKGEQKPSNWHMSPKCWQNISNINIYIQLTNILTLFPAYIQCKCKCQFPNPAPEVAQKPFNWHISPKFWKNISNINIYIEVTNIYKLLAAYIQYKCIYYKKFISPSLKGTQKPFNWHMSPKC